VEHLCGGDASLVLVQEAKDLRLADLVPAGWMALQDTSSDSKAGSGILVGSGITVDDWWLVKGCDAPPGGGMLPRWLCCAEVTHDAGQLVPISAHAPPPRYAGMQPGFADAVAAVVADYPQTAVVGADANQDIDQWARELGSGMVAVGKQSGICLVSRMPFTDVDLDNWGEQQGATDHPAVWGTIGA
jgi:hypothetical protein